MSISSPNNQNSMQGIPQADEVVRKAFGMLALISKGIEPGGWEVILQLYTTFVRPPFEYCV